MSALVVAEDQRQNSRHGMSVSMQRSKLAEEIDLASDPEASPVQVALALKSKSLLGPPFSKGRKLFSESLGEDPGGWCGGAPLPPRSRLCTRCEGEVG